MARVAGAARQQINWERLNNHAPVPLAGVEGMEAAVASGIGNCQPEMLDLCDERSFHEKVWQ